MKRRLKCSNEACPRKTFTERCRGVPPRRRVTPRLREQAAAEIADRGITPAETARHAGLSWPVAHDAFAARADAAGRGPRRCAPGHRRAPERPARWRIDGTGQYAQLADRWHTCFCDLSGEQGMLGQAEGRTATTPRTGCSGPARLADPVGSPRSTCARFSLPRSADAPGAGIAVDLFHVVQLAVKAAGDVRRRAVRDKYGRRGKAGDLEYGVKSLLVRNLENLSAAQFAKVIETLDADEAGQQIALAWIAKEKLRAALNLRARATGSPRASGRSATGCSPSTTGARRTRPSPSPHLAATISRWEDEIVAAVLTGVTNATSESLNRLAKLEARMAYGFRNPASQRRRVRTACTRGTRGNSHAPQPAGEHDP